MSGSALSDPPIEIELVDTPRRPAAAQASQRIHHAVILTVALVVLLSAALLEVRGQTQVAVFGLVLPEVCLWRRMLGWNCPGCGLTRSFVSLAHGDVAAAWRFHLVGPLLFAAVVFQVPYRVAKLWRLGATP